MVVKTHIVKTIKQLDRMYNASTTPEATYYSKLAIIELCGWIELSMDNIAEYFANKKLRTQPFKESFAAIKANNFGFEYKKNFRKMLSQTIGLHNMEIIETSINSTGDIDKLHATLNSLKILRNDAAHTFIGATTTYQAPSATLGQLQVVYPILKKIAQQVKCL